MTDDSLDRPALTNAEITEEMIEAAADAVQEYQFDMSALEARCFARAALEAAVSHLEKR